MLQMLESRNFTASLSEAWQFPSSCLLIKKFKGLFGFAVAPVQMLILHLHLCLLAFLTRAMVQAKAVF